jgi:hypothetical protein
MPNLFVPFNYQPDSAFIQTGAYNIPAGKYARIVDLSTNLTIAGSVAIADSQFSGSGSTGGGSTSKTAIFTNNTPWVAKVAAGWDSVGNGAGDFCAVWVGNPANTDYPLGGFLSMNTKLASVAGDNYASSDSAPPSGNFVVPAGTSVYVRAVHGGAGDAFYNFAGSYEGKKSNEFWLKSGTAVSGSRYFVQLYNEIS